jgi:hypothetical protein
MYVVYLRLTDVMLMSTHKLTAPIFKPLETGGYPFDRFPIVQHSNYSPWNIHHIHLDRMPKIDTRDSAKLRSWVTEHTSVQMSDRERLIQRSTHATRRRASEVLVNVKESLLVLVQDYTGVRQGPHSIFGLSEPTHGIYVIIFISGLRLDLAGSTVAIDAAVIPLSSETAQSLVPGIETMHELGKEIMQIKTLPAEVAAWKRLLPAFVERCRTWSHKPTCEYKSRGSAPRSVLMEDNPLCTCGEGVGFESPAWTVPAWQGLLPRATRAAISPLFAVSYLEVVAGPASKMQGMPPEL